MRRSRRRLRLRRCARTRRFRNWGTSEPDLCLEEAGSRQCGEPVRARGERFERWRGRARTRDGQALRQDRPTDGRTGFLGQEARSMSAPRSKSDGRNGLARTCRCAANARLWAWRARGSTASSSVAGGDVLAVMRRIDELHLELPFYGSRRMTLELYKEGRGVNRKRVRRLMRVMGIEALVPRPGTSKAAPGHKIYPYLLRGLKIVEPNHVWAADVTFIPMACGFLYLVVIIDWASRAVLGVAAVEHQRCELLQQRRWRARAPSVRNAADFQYRSALHIHRRGFRRQARGDRRRDFDGRTRPLHGQHFCRTAMALYQV